MHDPGEGTAEETAMREGAAASGAAVEVPKIKMRRSSSNVIEDVRWGEGGRNGGR